MSKELLISSTSLETRLAILENDQVTEIFIERAKNRRILGNIYKGKVTRVLPGMQAAFVNIGLPRDTFLYVSDFSEDFEEYEAHFENEKGEFAGPLPKGSAKKESNSDSDPPQHSAQRLVAEAGQILPESLDVSVSSGAQHTAGSAGVGSEVRPERRGSQILPRFLQPFAVFKSLGRPQEKSSPQPESPEKKADPPRQDPPRDSRKGRRKNSNQRSGQALIGDLLQEGQEILVQVAKEPIGRKGARITSHSVLPGRYLVVMPTVEHVGVSRRIVSDKERKRLKDIVLKLRQNSGRGFIVRTVGENKDKADFHKDMSYLTSLWEDIRRKAEKTSAPALVYAEPSLSQRVVRDYFSKEYRAIRVDDEEEYERIVDFVNQFNPSLVQRVHLYKKRKPIFDAYRVTHEIEKALRPKVWLKNGGHIVINTNGPVVLAEVIPHHPLTQAGFCIDQGRSRRLFRFPEDILPEIGEIAHVLVKICFILFLTYRSYDKTSSGIFAQFDDDVFEAFSLFVGDNSSRHSDVLHGGHKNQVTSGQNAMGGDPGSFLTDGLFGHLN